MRFVVLFLAVCALSFSSWAQLAIGLNGGFATTSKINYATNKSALMGEGSILFATHHFEGGLAAKLYVLSDAAYTSVFDLGVVANGKIPLNPNFDDKGSYITVGGGLGYGMADFGKGMGIGLQLAYGYMFNSNFAVLAELAPRYYDFDIDQDMYTGKWKGFAVNTVDRFIVLPFTIGIRVRFW